MKVLTPTARLRGAAAVFLALATSAGAKDRALLAHWMFDTNRDGLSEASGAAGASRSARLHGVRLIPGRVGKAALFDGKAAYAELGDLGKHDAVTIAFWLWPDDVNSKTWQGLVTSGGWQEGMIHMPMLAGRVEVHLHLGGPKDLSRARLRGYPLRRGVWHHVALTVERGKTMALYVNGFETDSIGVEALNVPIDLTKQVVGCEFDGRTVQARMLAGAIDDVRYYGRALSAKEVRALCPDAPPPGGLDPRNIRTGRRIPDEGYCDQPYVVVLKDGAWLCTMTTGPGREGQRGQHIMATRSEDRGKTWSKPVDIEPSAGPEASWIVPVVVPSGRVYGFYTYNGDNVRTLKGKSIRADTIGWYAYRYSDDGGRTWSKRFRLPLRLTACDRGNDWKGKVQIFWGIDKPNILSDGSTVFAFTKLGKYMLDLGEGWVFRSENLASEPDADKVRWELLPVGEHGIRHEEYGSVQEEHNIVPLADPKHLYCVYRTTRGHPAHSYSSDGGKTWTKPAFMTYSPGGRKVKTPRACPQLWRCGNGKYLFWYHNHSWQSFRGRNPVWIVGGQVKDGRMHWSQPEILHYDAEPGTGMSYPDLIEQDGRYWFTHTNKRIARVLEADKSLLEGLWSQGQTKTVSARGLVLDATGPPKSPAGIPLKGRLDLTKDDGLTVEAWVRFAAAKEEPKAGRVLVDTRDAAGRGVTLATYPRGAVQILLSDGTTKASWTSDPGVLSAGTLQHVVAIVDAHPRIITFVIDGVLCDGGPARTHGWSRYAQDLGDVTGTGKLRLAAPAGGWLLRARLYRRYLRTSEAVAHFHAGPEARLTPTRRP